MSITERLANMPIWAVLVTMAVLLAIRFLLIRQKTPIARSIAEIAESLAVAMGLVFLIIRPFIVQSFFIPSASMHPTLLEHDHILVNKFIYRFKEPQRGDIVVFKAPPEADVGNVERDFIKRVIGLPGDRVRITPGYVSVGDSIYNHSQLRGELAAPGSEGRVKLTDHGVFVDGKRVTDEEVAAALGHADEKVVIVPGRVYINGKPLDEPYIAEDPDEKYPRETTPREWIEVDEEDHLVVKIPEGRLLVMGDNRNDSNDSRYWGLLERDRILGKAMFIFWPLNRVGWIH